MSKTNPATLRGPAAIDPKVAAKIDPKAAPSVERMDWEAFKSRGFQWEQGEHIALIGPTGRGKSTLAGNILDKRRLVVALDLKGDDPALKRWGYESTPSWPLPDEGERLKGEIHEKPDGTKVRIVPPLHVRLAPPVRTRGDRESAAKVFADCLDDVFERGGWAVYVDELLIAVGRKFDLGDAIEDLMVHARFRGTSMVNATQAPRWIPKLTYDQATHLFIWPVRDTDGLGRVEEITGFGRAIRNTLQEMDKHETLYVKPPDTLIVTQCPPPDEVAEEPKSTRGVTPTPEGHDTPPRPKGGKFRRAAW